MNRRLALLGLGAVLWAGYAFAQSVGSPTNISCTGVYNFSGLSATTTAVTGKSGQVLNFCGWHVTNTTASGTFQITVGSKVTNPCDTGTTSITPALNVTSTAPSADHEQYSFFSSTQGQSLCISPSATTISGVLYYSIN
jgi:hypothetical protein